MSFKWSEEEKKYFEKASAAEQTNAMANAFLARDWVAFKWMADNGVNPNHVTYEMLWDAVRREDEDAVRKLVGFGCDVHRVEDIAFRDAVRLGNVQIAAFLQSVGADVNAVNSEAMSSAAERGDVQMIKMLRAWGVSAEGWNNEPLLKAINNNHKEAVKELIRLGANLSKDENHLALRAAIRLDNQEMGQIVLKSVKNLNEAFEILDESDAFLPEDWKQRLERWRLSLSI